MKKTLFFASLIAMVAVLATACKPKGDAPRALFSYSEDGLTVTFENLSQNATTYAWDFGDGKTSTEENPVHVYADYGDYVVKLTATNAVGSKSYEEELNLVRRAITIDGDFSDWTALGNKVAACVANEDNFYDAFLQEAKFARDEDYIYFYLNISDVEDEFDSEDDNQQPIKVRGAYNEILQFCLNCGDETTGCSFWYFDDPAIDILIECPSYKDFESASVYKCPAALNGQENENWEWDALGVFNAIEGCQAVVLGAETNADILADYPNAKRLGIEGRIDILKLSTPIDGSLKMGVVTLDPAWAETGALPQKNLADGATGKLIAVPVVE